LPRRGRVWHPKHTSSAIEMRMLAEIKLKERYNYTYIYRHVLAKKSAS